jgi:hypothetical protein
VALIIRKLTEAMIRAMRPDEELAAILREDIRPLWFAQVVRLLVFTGQRRGEVVALGHYPEWIAADGWATIPGTHQKSGRAQRVYLARRRSRSWQSFGRRARRAGAASRMRWTRRAASPAGLTPDTCCSARS